MCGPSFLVRKVVLWALAVVFQSVVNLVSFQSLNGRVPILNMLRVLVCALAQGQHFIEGFGGRVSDSHSMYVCLQSNSIPI